MKRAEIYRKWYVTIVIQENVYYKIVKVFYHVKEQLFNWGALGKIIINIVLAYTSCVYFV